jgi:hypothetical protein
MTRLGTLNQVDHLHKGSPRHCVIHSQWLLVSLTRQNPSGLAIPTQPNLLSKLHLNRWELVFRVSTWDTSWKLAAGRTPGNLDGPKKTAFLTCWTFKNRRSPMFRWYFSDPMDRSQHHQVSRPSAEIKSCSRCCNCLADLYSCRLCHTEVGLSENLGENLQIWCLIIIDHNFSHIK